MTFAGMRKGKSYPFADFPIEHMVAMQLRLEQEGWIISDRLPPADVERPPIPLGFQRRFGLEWVGKSPSRSDDQVDGGSARKRLPV